MDISSSTAPRTDQQNFDNYLAGPKTLTISEVKAGTAEQPIEIHLVEFPGQPYKPSKSMRRVLVTAWGAEASVYAGRKITLYGDPTVRFGSAVVGGLKISHLSHIDKPVKVALTVSRGKREPFTVQPLPDTPAPVATDTSSRDWLAELADANGDLSAIVALGKAAKTAHAGDDINAAILAEWQRVKEASA
jgi:hypothetical protein